MKASNGSRQGGNRHDRTKQQYRYANLRVNVPAREQFAKGKLFEVDGICQKNIIHHPHDGIGDKEEEKKKPKLTLGRSPIKIESPLQPC